VLNLVAYRDRVGREPFSDWFSSLDRHAAAKVTTVLARLSAGNLSDLKPVGLGVLERRINWGPGYRVYFGRDTGNLVILLAGGTKGRQQRDIAVAQARWADYRRRNQFDREGGS
jgi:putative addiction module killer protein